MKYQRQVHYKGHTIKIMDPTGSRIVFDVITQGGAAQLLLVKD